MEDTVMGWLIVITIFALLFAVAVSIFLRKRCPECCGELSRRKKWFFNRVYCKKCGWHTYEQRPTKHKKR